MKKVETFSFPPGENLYDSYEIVELLGEGWEGEVYLVKEKITGIERAAKFFFPHRNIGGRASKFYAKKLHRLRNCDVIIQYYSQNTLYWESQHIVYLVSEFIDGELLSEFLERQPGRRMHPFAALHLLHALASGMEKVHQMKEYHGDLHTDNIIVLHTGLKFDLKLLDLYSWGAASAEHIHDDVVDLIHVFYEVLGGKKHYSKLPKEIKEICCGLKRSLILKKFRTAGKLKNYLESMEWG
jgi:serine/threonine protein kinase